MRLNSLNRDMFKPFRSHSGLLGWVFGCVLEGLHRFSRGFRQKDASMRALWSDRSNCSHNVSQKVKRIRRLSEQTTWDKQVSAKFCGFLGFSSKICGFLRLSAKNSESVSTGVWCVPGFGAGFEIALERSKLQKEGENPGKGHFYFLRQTLVCTKPWFKRDLKNRASKMLEFLGNRKSAKISESCKKTANLAPFASFSLSLLIPSELACHAIRAHSEKRRGLTLLSRNHYCQRRNLA